MNFQDQLKDLHKQAKAQAAERERAESEAKIRQQQAEQANFAMLMHDVVPLKTEARYSPPPSHKPILPRQNREESLAQENYFYVSEAGTTIEIPDSFSKNGQGSNDIKRLQAGNYTVVADVDLHGYSQEQAQQVLNEFIEFVQQRGVCGEIIHGSGLGSKGYVPVLKSLVRRWLMQHPEVLAYCEPRKGNDGAVRILVKKRRKPDKWAE